MTAIWSRALGDDKIDLFRPRHGSGSLILLKLWQRPATVFHRFAPRFYEAMAKVLALLKELALKVLGWGMGEFFPFIFSSDERLPVYSESRVAGGAAPQMGPVHIAIVRLLGETICKWK